MTWEWSHAQEAYANVEKNIARQPREWKEMVYAEWRASQDRKGRITDDFNTKKYDRALAWVKTPGNMSDEQLDEFIWERTSEQARCENGGYNAHCCPFGCSPHFVSFSREGENEDPDATIQQGMDEDKHILHIHTDAANEWATANLTEADGFDGDDYIAPNVATMKETIKKMRAADLVVNTFDGYDD